MRHILGAFLILCISVAESLHQPSAGPPPFDKGGLGDVRHSYSAFLLLGASLRREGAETLPYRGLGGFSRRFAVLLQHRA